MKAIIGKKIGMTQIFTEDGTRRPVTVVDVSDVRVSKHIKQDENVIRVELGAGKKKKTNKADQGNYSALGYVPKFRTSVKVGTETEIPEVGTDLGADVFVVGDKVDVVSTNKGKGFQGVVKRWGFHGGPKSHGASDRLRAPGSIGAGQTFQRVIKGLRMGGHMGNVKQTIKNMKVLQVDTENGLLVLGGSVPGAKGQYVLIKAAR